MKEGGWREEAQRSDTMRFFTDAAVTELSQAAQLLNMATPT